MNHQTSKHEIAENLEEVSTLLSAQHASDFRVNAYRKAAQYISRTEVDIVSLALNNQEKDLIALPTIGNGIANLIIEYVHTGKSRLLNRLRGQNHPEALIETIPGIGSHLARDIVSQLNIHTLEELEIAAHDGRLDTVKGFGEGRLNLVKMYLASVLSQRTNKNWQQSSSDPPSNQPSIDLVIKIDNDYRRKAREGTLHKISPSRFNPKHKAWLPIYHLEHQGWHFTVMFSNTFRAHELGKTNDWVLEHYERDGIEGHATVVTASKGIMAGRRIVKGRLEDCRNYYQQFS